WRRWHSLHYAADSEVGIDEGSLAKTIAGHRSDAGATSGRSCINIIPAVSPSPSARDIQLKLHVRRRIHGDIFTDHQLAAPRAGCITRSHSELQGRTE